MVSIIIPVHNEEKLLPRCLAALHSAMDSEVIVVDAASHDATARIAVRAGARYLRTRQPNRAAQMNAGAALARGDVLLFLHGDCVLPADALEKIDAALQSDRRLMGGCFRMRLDGNRALYRLLSCGGDLFCLTTRWMFGDRGIFVRRSVFMQLGGFREIEIMEDVDFSRRLRKLGRTVLLPTPLISSARKFAQESAPVAVYRILRACVDFQADVPPHLIARRYYGGERCAAPRTPVPPHSVEAPHSLHGVPLSPGKFSDIPTTRFPVLRPGS